MKKINLKSVKSYLNRDEMRKISGGYGGGGCLSCTKSCACVINKYGCTPGAKVCL